MIDRTGKPCKKCNNGHYKETRLQDDMHGVLHCDLCDHEIPRWGESKARFTENFTPPTQPVYEPISSPYTTPHPPISTTTNNGPVDTNTLTWDDLRRAEEQLRANDVSGRISDSDARMEEIRRRYEALMFGYRSTRYDGSSS